MKLSFSITLALLASATAHAASFPYITLNKQTNHISDNGTAITFNGTPVGGGSATTGTLINTTATAAGNLVKFTDNTKTNTAPASSGDIQNALGNVYQATNSNLTAYAGTGTNTLLAAIGGVAKAGDTMTGALTLSSGNLTLSGAGGSLTTGPSGQVNDSGSTYRLNTTGLKIRGSGQIGFTGTTDSNDALDTILSRDGAAIFQLGLDAATATHQTLKAHDGSGTDKAGANLTLEGGQSTGTGRGGDMILRTANTSTTGSSANAYTERYHASAKFVDLTESTATTIGNIPLATGKVLGVKIFASIMASDGTDFQKISSDVMFSAVNKAGTVTVGAVTETDGTAAVSTGTLTVTYTAVANGASVDIKANAVSSLTQTILRAKYIVTAINSDDAITITPN